MDYDLVADKTPWWRLLITPGPILTLIGMIILTISVYYFNQASPGGDVDAIIEAQSRGSERLKSMLGLVAGVVVSLAGALVSVISFSRRNK